jgi:hypothetical protein
MRRAHVLLVALLVGAGVPRAARAEPAPEAPAPAAPNVEDLKHQGDEAMIALRYSDALEAYRRAWEATQSPALLYNMGRAYEGLGDFPKALDALEAFSDKAPPELKARVPRLKELLADVRSRVATLVVSSEVAGAEIRLGDRLVGKTQPGQVAIKVNAGAQHLRVTHEDYRTYDRDLTLVGGRVETIDLTLKSKRAPLLRVVSPVTGAVVTVDGRAVGVVPAETSVAPGAHEVQLHRDGYDPAATRVVVVSGEDKQIDVPMAVHDTVTKKWWFWTSIGAAVLLGGIATYVVVTTEKSPTSGTIPPGQVKAALTF